MTGSPLQEDALVALIVDYARQKYGYEPPPGGVPMDSGLDRLGLDSVDAVLIAAELEDAFGIALDPAYFLRFETLGEAGAAMRAEGLIE